MKEKYANSPSLAKFLKQNQLKSAATGMCIYIYIHEYTETDSQTDIQTYVHKWTHGKGVYIFIYCAYIQPRS